MGKALVMKIIIIVALVAVVLVGYRMIKGKAATLPTPAA